MKRLAIFVFVAFLASCKTPQQLIDKALSKDSSKVAEITRQKFPCIQKQVRPSDSLEYKAWQEGVQEIVDMYEHIIDSLQSGYKSYEKRIDFSSPCDSLRIYRALSSCAETNTKLRELVDKLKNQKAPPAIHDTIPIYDSADIFLLRRSHQAETNILRKYILDKEKENGKLKDKVVKLEGKISKLTKLLWIFFFIALCLTIWTFRKVILRIISPVFRIF